MIHIKFCGRSFFPTPSLKKHLLGSLLILISLSSCSDRRGPDVSDIDLNTDWQRFDRAFFESDTQTFATELQRLEEEFPPFFMNGGTEKFWFHQRTEELQMKLWRRVDETFGDMAEENHLLNQAMKRYYHYFGTDDTLEFYSYISRLDFEFPVLFADSICFAGTDLYLGADDPHYQHLPEYQRYERAPRFLVRDAIEAVLSSHLSRKEDDETFLDAMIHYGKLYYVLSLLLPEADDAHLLKFPSDKMKFAQAHEREMWIYFIRNDLLYKTNEDIQRRFIRTAPFSKFRTDLDRDTPGRIGRWFGLLIIRKYMQRHDGKKPQELFQIKDSQKILRESGYKP